MQVILYKATSGAVLVGSTDSIDADSVYAAVKSMTQANLGKSGIAVLVIRDDTFDSIKEDPIKTKDDRVIRQLGIY